MRLREVRARRAILIDDALRQKVQHLLMPVFWLISGENMIEATIFANDDNDVFNRRSGLMESTALSGSAWAWADAPRPKTEKARMDAQAMVVARHFLVSLRCIVSSEHWNQHRSKFR